MANETQQQEEMKLSNAVRKILASKVNVSDFDKLKAKIEDAADHELERYLIDARVSMPSLGGLPLPKGIGFHGYVNFELTEDEPGLGVGHEEALAHAQELAAAEFPNHQGVAICSVSRLPVGW